MLGRSQWIGVAVAALLVAWATVAIYRNQVRYNLWPRNFGIVEEGKIYRAGEQNPGMLRHLVERYKIKTIVDLGAYDSNPRGERQEVLAAKALNVERFEFPLKGDGTGDPNNYVKALHVITDSTKQPVLVHCSTGAQRTGGCIVLYRVATQGKTVEQVYAETLQYKHDPADNPNLRPYLDKWAAEISRSFRSGQTIPYAPERIDAGASPVR
jgi:protein tyrosine/serine phosphatase